MTTTSASLIEELEHALANGTEAQRESILSRITDLFISGANCYTRGQVKLFDDLMVGLVAAIESEARVQLAQRLAPVDNAPANVIRNLALDDNIEVARPVLRGSRQLQEADLITAANLKGQQHLAAISERETLSEGVTDVLVTRGNRHVVCSVAKNAGARFSSVGFRFLVKRAAGDDELAAAVGMRADVPRQQFMKLVEEASAEVRAKLRAEIPSAPAAAVLGAVGAAEVGIRKAVGTTGIDYTAARAAVEALRATGSLSDAAVAKFAQEKKFEETVVSLSLLATEEIKLVERAMEAADYQLVAILCKLANLSQAALNSVLLLKAARSGKSPDEFKDALRGFARLQASTARRVLHFYHERSAQPAAAAG